MSYELNEQPVISATIYYYSEDVVSNLELSKIFMVLLKKYNYFNITNVEICKNIIENDIVKNHIIRHNLKRTSNIDIEIQLNQWLNENDTAYIYLIGKEEKNQFWEVTWFKESVLPNGIPNNKNTFNHLEINSSYERLSTPKKQNSYLNLFIELSRAYNSFYGNIEDVSSAIDIIDNTKEKTFNEHRIQALYWGNYFGKNFCSKIGITKLNSLPFENKKQIGNGFFVCISDNISDSKDNFDLKLRKKFLKYLK